jgi:hypothetical protein
VFITHGEEDVATGFAGNLSGQLGFDAIAPEYQQTIELG